MGNNYKQKQIAIAKAKLESSRKRILKVNSDVTEESGIYVLYRTDEDGVKHSYVGQATHLLTRLAQHCLGFQYIDNSIKAHGFYSNENPYGYKIGVMKFPLSQLDEKEQEYILMYRQHGFQMKNLTTGSQGKGKEKMGQGKAPKGYRDGLKQGRKQLAKELSHIIDKHLVVSIRADKAGNKVSQEQFEKFKYLLDESTYKEE